MEKSIADIAEKASSINELLTKIYYPLGLYINLITNFKILDLLKLLLVNIIPLYIFIMIGSIYYINIIFKSTEISIVKNNKKGRVISRKPIISLTIKELKRYLSSPIYMFNTGFGLLIGVGFSIGGRLKYVLSLFINLLLATKFSSVCLSYNDVPLIVLTPNVLNAS